MLSIWRCKITRSLRLCATISHIHERNAMLLKVPVWIAFVEPRRLKPETYGQCRVRLECVRLHIFTHEYNEELQRHGARDRFEIEFLDARKRHDFLNALRDL